MSALRFEWGLAVLLLTGTPALAQQGPLGIGTPASADAIAGWNIDVRPDGAGLPPGQGSVAQGADLYARACAACHGAHGEGSKAYPRLVGGIGTLATPTPVQTVGSYWPYATTLFDYIRRAMPFNAPQSLTPDEVYAVSAYVLHMNGLVGAEAVLDATSLPQVAMPNRDGFVPVYSAPRTP
jgi:S-disulfanyl-L-cysteine oxidoreductase SoxD